MGDSFKAPAIRLDVPPGMSIWDVVDNFATYARHTLESLPGRIHKADFTVWDKSGSNLTRQSIAELREAVRTHHLDVKYFYGSVHLAAPGALPWHADTAISVWADLAEREKPDRVRIEIESTNKIQMDGVHTQIRNEAEHFQQHSELAPKVVQITQAGVVPPARATTPPDAPTPTTAHTIPSASVAHSTPPSWLSRTWRDHTAMFVVTVVGGLVVAALGTWLGLHVL
ncbi:MULTISPECIES: hypothetical protein [unclassified Microbacterium]|uniref:hypothetical protein n=1 Tax=unclassified Microbacterium TaxID=2609290 RepID=UPI00301ABF13